MRAGVGAEGAERPADPVGPPTGNTKRLDIRRFFQLGVVSRGFGVAVAVGVAVALGSAVAVSVAVGCGDAAPARAETSATRTLVPAGKPSGRRSA